MNPTEEERRILATAARQLLETNDDDARVTILRRLSAELTDLAGVTVEVEPAPGRLAARLTWPDGSRGGTLWVPLDRASLEQLATGEGGWTTFSTRTAGDGWT